MPPSSTILPAAPAHKTFKGACNALTLSGILTSGSLVSESATIHAGQHMQSTEFESVHGSLMGLPEFETARVSLSTSNATVQHLTANGFPTNTLQRHLQSADAQPDADDVWKAVASDSSSDFSYWSSSGDEGVEAVQRRVIREARQALKTAQRDAGRAHWKQVLFTLTVLCRVGICFCCRWCCLDTALLSSQASPKCGNCCV
jgi:hypothetical protein